MNRIAVLFLFVIVCSNTVSATQTAQDLVIKTSEAMLQSIKDEKRNNGLTTKRIYELVEDIVLPHFDFERMSRLVLGKYWRKASLKEQAEFVNEFQTLLVRTYGTAMEEYTNEKIIYLPFNDDKQASEVVVKTEVDQQSGFPIPIDYKLYEKDGVWKVYDVSIDDVSLVLNYRTSFASEIRREGGVDALIKKLRTRNQEAFSE